MTRTEANDDGEAESLPQGLSAEATGMLLAMLNLGALKRFDSIANELVAAGLAELSAGKLRATRVALAWKARISRGSKAPGFRTPRASPR